MRYYVDKKKFTTENVEELAVVFQNGNRLEIDAYELVDIRLHFYDRLLKYWDSACFVGQSGYVKLRILAKNQKNHDEDAFLHNPEDYAKDRKAYIETRCTEDNDVDHIIFYDENCWSDNIFGDIRCHMEEDFLILQFVPNPKYGSADADKAYIDLPNVISENIRVMKLDFENCETATVYRDEILETDLSFEEQLEWDGGDFCRVVKSGTLKLRFEEDYLDRDVHFWESERKKPGIRKIIRRICGKGEDIHDICHLYITYENSNCQYGQGEEKIEIPDMRFYEEITDDCDEALEEDSCEDIDLYIGGYAKLEQDGTVTVKFGKCCADDVRRIVDKRNYKVEIKDYAETTAEQSSDN